MRAMVAVAALLLAACGQQAQTAARAPRTPPALEPVALPQGDGAGNQMVALEQIGEGGMYCAGDETWCVLTGEEGAVSVTENGGAQTALPARGERWPNAIVSQGAAIVGVIETETQSYSGGGGSASHLTLYRVANGIATEIAKLPYAASIDIRACFTEEDTRRRLDACSDQYNFVSRVRLDETVTSGAPRIVLETAAGTFPGRVTRGADSLERPALTQADLVWVQDDVCSFRRTYSATAAGPYAPDAELPACSDYLEP
jgi:hypothetical protein